MWVASWKQIVKKKIKPNKTACLPDKLEYWLLYYYFILISPFFFSCVVACVKLCFCPVMIFDLEVSTMNVCAASCIAALCILFLIGTAIPVFLTSRNNPSASFFQCSKG